MNPIFIKTNTGRTYNLSNAYLIQKNDTGVNLIISIKNFENFENFQNFNDCPDFKLKGSINSLLTYNDKSNTDILYNNIKKMDGWYELEENKVLINKKVIHSIVTNTYPDGIYIYFENKTTLKITKEQYEQFKKDNLNFNVSEPVKPPSAGGPSVIYTKARTYNDVLNQIKKDIADDEKELSDPKYTTDVMYSVKGTAIKESIKQNKKLLEAWKARLVPRDMEKDFINNGLTVERFIKGYEELKKEALCKGMQIEISSNVIEAFFGFNKDIFNDEFKKSMVIEMSKTSIGDLPFEVSFGGPALPIKDLSCHSDETQTKLVIRIMIDENPRKLSDCWALMFVDKHERTILMPNKELNKIKLESNQVTEKFDTYMDGVKVMFIS